MKFACAILSSVAPPAVPFFLFSMLCHKRQDFRRKVIEHKMRVLIFLTILSEAFLILRITERGIIRNVFWSSCKVPGILVIF